LDLFPKGPRFVEDFSNLKFFHYLFRRIAYIIPILFGLLMLTFFISRVIPADPVALIAGGSATKEQIDELKRQHGFDKPLYKQFLIYVADLSRGDLGISLYSRRPVVKDLMDRFPATFELSIFALFISVLFAIPIGVVCALKRNSKLDHLMRGMTIASLAIVGFWLGIMLQLLFSYKLGIFSLGRRISVAAPDTITGLYLIDSLMTLNGRAFINSLWHLCLPGVTLAFPAFATLVRFTRSGLLDVINREYVLYETSMGIPRWLVIFKYALRNAMIPVVTQIGLLIGYLLAGAVVIETVFDWPGLGIYAVESMLMSDYKAILGVTLLSGLAYTISNILIDIVLTFVDPRKLEQ
jgi:peptide/nickel transport system permease protein